MHKTVLSAKAYPKIEGSWLCVSVGVCGAKKGGGNYASTADAPKIEVPVHSTRFVAY